MQTEFLLHLLKTTDLESAWSLLTEKMKVFEVDRIIYGYTRFRTENSFGEFEDNLVLSNHDPEYLEKYLGERLYYHSPMTRWANDNSGAESWNWVQKQLAQGNVTKKEREVLEFNKQMGVTAGYTISFHSASHRTRSILALTARRGLDQNQFEEIWKQHGEHLELIWQVANLKLTSLPYATHTRKLTHRQREALEWVGDGKTTQDTANIMGLTQATVEKHLRLAREMLNVETTAQAIVNTPPAESRWLRVTAKSRIGPPFGGLRSR